MHHGMEDHHQAFFGSLYAPLLLVFCVGATLLYLAAVRSSNRRYRRWPAGRAVCWCAGVWSAAAAVAGPLAERAHGDFAAHMAGHLLLGMLAPFLLAAAAPVTLLLRTLDRAKARRATRWLNGRLPRFAVHPVTALVLNIGGLWALYTTGLYAAMHQHGAILLAVHAHLFLAGYLFTASIVYTDPVAHRFSFAYRAVVLVLAFAGHSILSKIVYASPPPGVPAAQAQAGARLMYYGGDAVELLLILALCYQGRKPLLPQLRRPGRAGQAAHK